MHALVFPLYKSVHTLVSVISVGNRSIIARNVIFSPYPFSKERERERNSCNSKIHPCSIVVFHFSIRGNFNSSEDDARKSDPVPAGTVVNY